MTKIPATPRRLRRDASDAKRIRRRFVAQQLKRELARGVVHFGSTPGTWPDLMPVWFASKER